MDVYKTKASTIKGTSYEEVVKTARKAYGEVKAQRKRSPYVRMKYFKGEKVFVNLFWEHNVQMHKRDRLKRLPFYAASLELISETRHAPQVTLKKSESNLVYYRFNGITQNGRLFTVQIKENIKTGRKDFMSVFPKK
jgi:hypothetical protein